MIVNFVPNINVYFLRTEPIQSRCAVLRYSKLSDAQILARLLEVCDKEKVGDHMISHMICLIFDLSLCIGAQD